MPFSTRLTSDARNLVRDILVFEPEGRLRLNEIVTQKVSWYQRDLTRSRNASSTVFNNKPP